MLKFGSEVIFGHFHDNDIQVDLTASSIMSVSWPGPLLFQLQPTGFSCDGCKGMYNGYIIAVSRMIIDEVGESEK